LLLLLLLLLLVPAAPCCQLLLLLQPLLLARVQQIRSRLVGPIQVWQGCSCHPAALAA
jgi:hypothetical protein